jgi:hypothetical protein
MTRVPLTDLQAVVLRLEGVEKCNRRLAWATVALAAIIVLGWVVSEIHAAPKNDIVEAKGLILMDKGGHKRIEVSGASPLLTFFDSKGEELVTLDGDHLAFFDGHQPFGAPARILLQVQNGDAVVRVTDNKGKLVWSVP